MALYFQRRWPSTLPTTLNAWCEQERNAYFHQLSQRAHDVSRTSAISWIYVATSATYMQRLYNDGASTSQGRRNYMFWRRCTHVDDQIRRVSTSRRRPCRDIVTTLKLRWPSRNVLLWGSQTSTMSRRWNHIDDQIRHNDNVGSSNK